MQITIVYTLDGHRPLLFTHQMDTSHYCLLNGWMQTTIVHITWTQTTIVHTSDGQKPLLFTYQMDTNHYCSHITWTQPTIVYTSDGHRPLLFTCQMDTDHYCSHISSLLFTYQMNKGHYYSHIRWTLLFPHHVETDHYCLHSRWMQTTILQSSDGHKPLNSIYHYSHSKLTLYFGNNTVIRATTTIIYCYIKAYNFAHGKEEQSGISALFKEAFFQPSCHQQDINTTS